MKQIQQDIVQALRNRKSFCAGSAAATSYSRKYHLEGYRDKLQWGVENEFRYELWGHAIAFGNTEKKKIYVSVCGFNTPTTVSRLNAVFAGLDIPMSAVIRQKKIVYSLNGHDVAPVFAKRVLAGEWTVKFV